MKPCELGNLEVGKKKLKDRKIINNEERVSKRKGHRERRGRHGEGETRGWGGGGGKK